MNTRKRVFTIESALFCQKEYDTYAGEKRRGLLRQHLCRQWLSASYRLRRADICAGHHEHAQEFGLEQTAHEKLLLCIVAAATPDALHALTEMIVPAQPLIPRAVCEGYSSTLHICSDGARYDIPAEEQSGAFLAAMQDQQLPLPAVLAALTTWCTGYQATLFWESRP